jgi:hypothetical protein
LKKNKEWCDTKGLDSGTIGGDKVVDEVSNKA